VEKVVQAVEHIIKVSKDKKFLKKSEGHGKFEKVSYEVHKLSDVLRKRIAQEDDEEGEGGKGVQVDLNWQVPLGFEGGAYQGGG